jgi:ribosome modulation factor
VEGYNARRWLGKGSDANPYPAGSPEHAAWLGGWRKGAADSGAAEDAHNAKEVGHYGEIDDETDDDGKGGAA